MPQISINKITKLSLKHKIPAKWHGWDIVSLEGIEELTNAYDSCFANMFDETTAYFKKLGWYLNKDGNILYYNRDTLVDMQMYIRNYEEYEEFDTKGDPILNAWADKYICIDDGLDYCGSHPKLMIDTMAELIKMDEENIKQAVKEARILGEW
tara:strand:+ start:301 stop:759 length:459 start_codon:yes stop_codon:yes gene_type:complete